MGLLIKLLLIELETPGGVSPVKTLPWQFHAEEAALLLGEHCYQRGPCTAGMSSLAEEQGY